MILPPAFSFVEARKENIGHIISITTEKQKRDVSDALKKQVLASQNGKCEHCGDNIYKGFCEVDHIIALDDNGSNCKDNLMGLCIKCHRFKNKMTNLKKNGYTNDEIKSALQQVGWNENIKTFGVEGKPGVRDIKHVNVISLC